MSERKAKYANNAPLLPTERRTKVTPLMKRQSNCGYHGGDLEPDEVEFLMAMDEYKRANRRPFPTWSEVLWVIRELGYRKVNTNGIGAVNTKIEGSKER